MKSMNIALYKRFLLKMKTLDIISDNNNDPLSERDLRRLKNIYKVYPESFTEQMLDKYRESNTSKIDLKEKLEDAYVYSNQTKVKTFCKGKR